MSEDIIKSIQGDLTDAAASLRDAATSLDHAAEGLGQLSPCPPGKPGPDQPDPDKPKPDPTLPPPVETFVPRPEITAPLPGETVTGPAVRIHYRVTGDLASVKTVVASMDGAKRVATGREGSVVFDDVRAGEHRAIVELADDKEALIPDASASVTFTVVDAPPPVEPEPEPKPPATPVARLRITSPAQGATVDGTMGNMVHVTFAIDGDKTQVSHGHLSLNGAPEIRFEPSDTMKMFDVAPGPQVLTGSLADMAHATISGSEVRVEFTVRGSGPEPDKPTDPDPVKPPIDPAPLPPLSTAPVATVTVSTDLAEIGVGGSTTARATARSAADKVLSGRTVSWTSSDPTVATVNLGTVLGIAPGTATITASIEEKSGSARISVRAADAGHDHGKPPETPSGGPKVITSGPWSDPKTWEGGKLPAKDDVVAIPAGKVVLYDLADGPRLPTVTVEAGGTLRYPPDRSTRMHPGSFWVAAGGTLEIGTADDPIHPDVLHEIIIADLPPDLVNYPDQLGNGLIVYGTALIHGAPRTPTFVRLAREPKAGDTTLVLAEAVSGWRPGDRLVLPGSIVWGYWETEELNLKSVSGDGLTLTVAEPLAHDHPGLRFQKPDPKHIPPSDPDGKAPARTWAAPLIPGTPFDFLPYVANLSRNVVIRSENPAGTRGHTIYTERADVDIRHAEFRDLGRTKLAVIDEMIRFPLDPAALIAVARGGATDDPDAFTSVQGTGGEFRVDVPNGDYEVEVLLADPGLIHDSMRVWLRGVVVAENVWTLGDSKARMPFPVRVTDGSVRVRLAGGRLFDPKFALASIRIKGVALPSGLAFDFGPAATPAAKDSTRVSTEPYTAARGHGWLSGEAITPAVNQIGRYPWHAHHLLGPRSGRPDGYQFSLVGCSAWNSTAEGAVRKWGIAVHASHYGLVRGNVIFNVSGGGLVTEDGNETENILERNFIVNVAGSGGDARDLSGGRSHAGTGLYLAGLANVVRDNVVAGTINDAYALACFGESAVRKPTAPGQDPSSYVPANMHAFTIRGFSGNEGYATKVGIAVWNIGVSDPSQRSVIKDHRMWNPGQVGVYFYPSYRVRLDGLVTRGDYRAQAVINGHYAVPGMEIVNSDIQGCWTGVLIPTTINEPDAPLVVEDTYLCNTINLGAATLEGIEPQRRHIVLRDVRFGTPAGMTPGVDHWHIDYHLEPEPGQPSVYSYNVLAEDRMDVYGYNGVAGDDFRVYLEAQAPGEVVPHQGDQGIAVGAPEPGLTNAQAWEKYGIAVAGAVAPKDAVRRPGIKGLVVPVKEEKPKEEDKPKVEEPKPPKVEKPVDPPKAEEPEDKPPKIEVPPKVEEPVLEVDPDEKPVEPGPPMIEPPKVETPPTTEVPPPKIDPPPKVEVPPPTVEVPGAEVPPAKPTDPPPPAGVPTVPSG